MPPRVHSDNYYNGQDFGFYADEEENSQDQGNGGHSKSYNYDNDCEDLLSSSEKAIPGQGLRHSPTSCHLLCLQHHPWHQPHPQPLCTTTRAEQKPELETAGPAGPARPAKHTARRSSQMAHRNNTLLHKS